ncbi:MAG: DUF3810 domain-containing protein [bacterium]
MKSPTKLRAGVIGLALSFYLLIQILAQYPAIVENYYSNGLYPLIVLIISNFSSYFSFSISEMMLWLILLLGIPFVINQIKTKRMSITQIALNLIITGAAFYVWFYLFWGINYFRVPLRTKLNLENVQLSFDAFDSTFAQIIDRGNELNLSYSIKEVKELNAIIDETYPKVLTNLGLPKVPATSKIKTFFGNWILNKTTTSGWLSPFFHEVHYNSDLLIFELPFVLAHEKAHLMGYTSEAEANFLAHLVCTIAPDPLCQYSGHLQVLGYFFQTAKNNKSKKAYFTDQLSDGVKLDLEAVKERWQSHKGIISNLTDKGYHLYLQANQVKEGIENYARVVDLLVRYYHEKPFVNREK